MFVPETLVKYHQQMLQCVFIVNTNKEKNVYFFGTIGYFAMSVIVEVSSHGSVSAYWLGDTKRIQS